MSSVTKNKKGILLPPSVGYSLSVFFKLVAGNRIPLKYYPKLLVIFLINLINFPFRTYERLLINPRYKKVSAGKPPVFIVGHWRSGTTHLHNLLSLDPQMGYTTTYQSVFPDTLFNWAGRFLFQGFSKLLIPGKRAGDNVTMGSSLPQEEEFALGDKTPVSYYYFWMFPKKISEYYEKFIRFRGIEKKLEESWRSDYRLLISKALKNTGGSVYLSKNPPNTGRIDTLLEMYPDAKFIHIYRNPVEVFLSTRNFFRKMMPHLQLQDFSNEEIDKSIIEIYKKMMKDYFQQSEHIPEGQLAEVAFEDLEKDPLKILNRIYTKLDIEGFETAKPGFTKYLDSMKNYKKNKHRISKKLVERLSAEWGFAMDRLKYSLPDHIEVTDG